eukprot:TRINITY_DN76098_c0_g1_i1.p1 TRINITY_DN76098_c0_g1~~TRINITY_DN76098_c0_g1_i1.p1  ORF type:complete len:354 (+),score=10.45 TRINITY_DN76098_c0_g1_i1:125-1186(+)
MPVIFQSLMVVLLVSLVGATPAFLSGGDTGAGTTYWTNQMTNQNFPSTSSTTSVTQSFNYALIPGSTSAIIDIVGHGHNVDVSAFKDRPFLGDIAAYLDAVKGATDPRVSEGLHALVWTFVCGNPRFDFPLQTKLQLMSALFPGSPLILQNLRVHPGCNCEQNSQQLVDAIQKKNLFKVHTYNCQSNPEELRAAYRQYAQELPPQKVFLPPNWEEMINNSDLEHVQGKFQAERKKGLQLELENIQQQETNLRASCNRDPTICEKQCHVDNNDHCMRQHCWKKRRFLGKSKRGCDMRLDHSCVTTQNQRRENCKVQCQATAMQEHTTCLTHAKTSLDQMANQCDKIRAQLSSMG